MPNENTGLIYELLSKAAAAMPAIGKAGVMEQGPRYNYRKLDDVIDAARTILPRYGISVVPEFRKLLLHEIFVTSKGAKMTHILLEYAHRFVAPDGSEVVAVAVGEGMDGGDKAANKAHSASLKYAICESLLIAYSMEDSDDGRPELQEPMRSGSELTPGEQTLMTQRAPAPAPAAEIFDDVSPFDGDEPAAPAAPVDGPTAPPPSECISDKQRKALFAIMMHGVPRENKAEKDRIGAAVKAALQQNGMTGRSEEIPRARFSEVISVLPTINPLCLQAVTDFMARGKKK